MATMPTNLTRRDTLRMGIAASSMLALIPEWALAQGDVDVPFTDLPANFNPGDSPTTRQFDIRKIDGLTVPKDKHFALQHFDRPQIDGATYKLKVTGLLNKPMELSLADLKAMKSVDVVTGYECSGNSPRAIQALSGCVKYTGVRLADVLKRAGVQEKAREVVFLGTDHGASDVVFRQQTFKLDQQFGRSIPVADALGPDPLLAWNINGEPLGREHGFPLRLMMPGYYGVANVKWLSEIRVQRERYVGHYRARWYRSIRGVGGSGKDDGPDTQWIENEVTRLQLKSVIARVTKSGNSHVIKGFVLNDGTPSSRWKCRSTAAHGKRRRWTRPTPNFPGSYLALSGTGPPRASTPSCHARRTSMEPCSRRPRSYLASARSSKTTGNSRAR